MRRIGLIAILALLMFGSAFEARGQTFTDDPLQVGVTPIRAVHITELRSSINSQRTSKGLPAFAWTDPTLTLGVTVVRRVHALELRTALDDVYRAMGLTVPVYTDPSLVVGQTPIKAVHLNELRANVRAVPSCTYAVAPITRTINHGSQNLSFTLTTPSACAWTAQAADGFLTRTSAGSGTGSSQITYAAAANATFITRSAQLTIAGQTVTVSQMGVGPTITGPTNQLHEETWHVAVPITATDPLGEPITYSAFALPPGVAVTPSTGLISGQLTSDSSNIHYVTVRATAGGRWSHWSFRWLVRCPPADYVVSPRHKELSAGGGTEYALVTASPGCAWEATSDFVRIENGDARMGDGTQQEAQFWLANNPSPQPQAGLLTVAGKDVVVTQRGEQGQTCTFSVQSNLAELHAGGGTGRLMFTPDDANCQWAVGKSASWITLSGPTRGLGAGSIGFTIAPNREPTTRNGYVLVNGHEVHFEQPAEISMPGPSCEYSVAPTQITVPSAGGTGTLTVATLSQCPWSATSNTLWARVGWDEQSLGHGEVVYEVAANPIGLSRQGAINVAGRTITVIQQASDTAPPPQVEPPQTPPDLGPWFGFDERLTLTNAPGLPGWPTDRCHGNCGLGCSTSMPLSLPNPCGGFDGKEFIPSGTPVFVTRQWREYCRYGQFIERIAIDVYRADGEWRYHGRWNPLCQQHDTVCRNYPAVDCYFAAGNLRQLTCNNTEPRTWYYFGEAYAEDRWPRAQEIISQSCWPPSP